MATLEEYLDYAELAQASYGSFTTTQTYSEYFSRSHRPRWECILKLFYLTITKWEEADTKYMNQHIHIL
jgi:hypothetical protein